MSQKIIWVEIIWAEIIWVGIIWNVTEPDKLYGWKNITLFYKKRNYFSFKFKHFSKLHYYSVSHTDLNLLNYILNWFLPLLNNNNSNWSKVEK